MTNRPEVKPEGSFTIRKSSDVDQIVKEIVMCIQHCMTEADEVEVKVEPFCRKTDAQNRMQHKWYAEAAQQGDQTAEEYRAECKAYCGIPILCRDSDEYREAYEKYIKPLPYEQKLAMMAHPIDYPVTRAMGKRQLSEFLDAVWHRLTVTHGFRLTHPDDQGRAT